MLKIVKNPRTDVDVQLLCDVFPDLLPDGREITHAQVEAALHANRRTARYRTVVAKWRRRVMRERCVFLDGISAQGRGFVALTPDEMVRYGNRNVRHAGRKIRKALAVASTPDDRSLSEETRKYRALLTVAMTKILAQHGDSLRDVSRALQPMKQLPRRA